MKKLGYRLLYGIPGLISAGFGLIYIPIVANRMIKTFGIELGSASGIIMIALFSIFLSILYLFYAIKQDYINKYTKRSVLSWYIFFVLSLIIYLNDPRFVFGSDSNSFDTIFTFLWFLLVALFFTLSVIFTHISGLIKGEIKPKILNLLLVILGVIIIVSFIFSFN